VLTVEAAGTAAGAAVGAAAGAAIGTAAGAAESAATACPPDPTSPAGGARAQTTARIAARNVLRFLRSITGNANEDMRGGSFRHGGIEKIKLFPAG
jgi:hypothetical protein